jgi:hypothetical protein
MPTRLVPYDLSDGSQIIVEEEYVDRGGMVANPVTGLAAKAKKGFEETLAAIRPTVAAVMDQLSGIAEQPDQITLELGFALKGEVGAVLTKAATEGTIKLTLTWKPTTSASGPK